MALNTDKKVVPIRKKRQPTVKKNRRNAKRKRDPTKRKKSTKSKLVGFISKKWNEFKKTKWMLAIIDWAEFILIVMIVSFIVSVIVCSLFISTLIYLTRGLNF